MNKYSLNYVQHQLSDDALDQELFDLRFEYKQSKSPKERSCLNAYIKLIQAEIAHRDYIFYHADGE